MVMAEHTARQVAGWPRDVCRKRNRASREVV